MRVALVQVPEVTIESLRGRFTGRAFTTKSPLADERGRVALVGKGLGNRPFFQRQGQPTVAANEHMASVLPRHEDATRRRTHGRTRVGIGKTRPLAGKTIDVRGQDLVLAVAPKISIPKIVSHDEDDVSVALPKRTGTSMQTTLERIIVSRFRESSTPREPQDPGHQLH